MASKTFQLKILSCAVVLSVAFNICFSLIPLKEVAGVNFGVRLALNTALYTYVPVNLAVGGLNSETKINNDFDRGSPVRGEKANDGSANGIYGFEAAISSPLTFSPLKQKYSNNPYALPGGDKRLCNMPQFYCNFTIPDKANIMFWLIFLLMYLAVVHRNKRIIINKNHIKTDRYACVICRRILFTGGYHENACLH
ncbi:MAG: hypothetical protein LBR69_03840 [Endomicrobium sp.]|nr:hypothetical protein [Endomicrobium sp.]